MLPAMGGTGFPFVVDATASNPLQYLPASGPAYSHLSATVTTTFAATSGTYTYLWTQMQDTQNPLAVDATSSGKSGFSGATSASAFVALPVAGVYEFQVTVTDAKNPALSVVRNVWVRVWDSKPAFGSDPLMVAPGCAAPTTVQTIHSDPGPYQHPRVLCTPADQAAMHARVTGGSLVATAGYKTLVQQSVSSLLSSPITADLVSYMGLANNAALATPYLGSYTGSPKTLQSDIANDAFVNYYALLWYAGYVAWADPADANISLQAVANLSAALAHYHLLQVYTAGAGSMPGTFNTSNPDYIGGLDQIGNPCDDVSGLALAYDFAYNNMSPAQQEDVRKLLFAAGYNRTTSTIYYRGTNQNGDFSNLGENHVLVSNAIAGEEGSVRNLDPGLYAQFSAPVTGCPWTSVPQAGALPTDPQAFPYSTGSGQGDLQRELWWSIDKYVSAWGWTTNREAYYGFSALYLYPAYLSFAIHGGENQWITNNAFDTKQMIIWELYGGDKGSSVPSNLPGLPTGSAYTANDFLYDHHDGGSDYREAHIVFLKYMFPDDLTIDYWYQQNLPIAFRGSATGLQFPIWYAMFGLDPIGLKGGTLTSLSQVGANDQQGKLIQVDPEMGATVVRSDWTENATELYFDTTWQPSGHWHSEQNSFSFFSNGRAWAFAGGRHEVDSDCQSAVLYQDPNFASDPATHGYRGESITAATSGTPGYECFPPTPGHLLNVTEDPNHVFATMMGDATFGYLWGHANPATPAGPIGRNLTSFMPTGFYDYYRSIFTGVNPNTPSQDSDFDAAYTDDIQSSGISKIRPTFLMAKRSIVFVRKPSPYALIIDDFDADGATHNYRWVMNSAEGFAPGQNSMCVDANGKDAAASVTLLPGSATNTQAVFYHPVDVNGGARLLIKDCTEPIAGMTTDPISLEAKTDISFVNAINSFTPSVSSGAAGSPPSPDNFAAAVQSGGTSVALSWTNESTSNATNNVVAYRPLGTTAWTTYATLAPTATTELIQGLTTQNTDYQFEIYATNAAGNSAPDFAAVSPYLESINTNRVFIDHNNVVKPQYKVLLFPFTTGNPATPTTSTVVNGNITTITIKNPADSSGHPGPIDTITLDANKLASNPAQYVLFSRAAPTVATPTITIANSDLSVAYGSAVTYSGITAKSSTGAPLPVSYSVPSGTVFASGQTTVTATAFDPATGAEASATFIVGTAPAAPVASIQSIYNADATLADNGITLGWPTVTNATSYNVYRAISATGTYSLVQGHIAPCVPNNDSISNLTIFNDRGLAGTAYFYHVTSVFTDSLGVDHEGTPSNVVAMTQPVPSALSLTFEGIGHNSNPNSGVGFAPLTSAPLSFLLSQSNQISKSGYNFQYPFDEGFALLGKTWTGDGTFTVRVTGEYENFGTATDPNQQVSPFYGSSYGLIFRDNAPTTDPGSVAEAGVYYQENVGHSNSVYAYSRPLIPYGGGVNSSRTTTGQGAINTPVWIRLSRVGSLFMNSYSTDGQTWTAGAPSTIAMSSTTQIGVNMAAGGSTNQDNGTFDDLVFLSPPKITPGNGVITLDWSQSTGAASYTLSKSTNPNGPFEPVVTNTLFTSCIDHSVVNLTPVYYLLTAQDASGVVTTVPVISGTAAAVATPIVTATATNGSVTLNWAAIPEATSYTVYQSTTPDGTVTAHMVTANNYVASGLTNGSPCYFFVVAKGANGNSTDSTQVGVVPNAWTDLNVGTAPSAGLSPAPGASAADGVITVTGSGADVNGTNDAFNYYYRPWSGDGTFITHVGKITTTNTSANASAKVGLMFRAAPLSSPAAGNVFEIDSLSKVTLQNRPVGGSTTYRNGPGAPPNWLKLVRSGSNFTAFTSVDAVNWLQVGSTPVSEPITDPANIGLAVNAQSSSAVCTALFDTTSFLVIPQGLMATNVQGTHVDLNWTVNPQGNATDATALQVEMSPTGANNWTVLTSSLSPGTSTYTPTGLSTRTSYDFRIKELDGAVASDYDTLTGVTTTAEDLPKAPTNLTAVVQGGTSVMLAWNNQVTNATDIVVGYRLSGTSSWTTYGAALAPTTTNELIQNLVGGKSYDFEVYATNSEGASLNPNVVTVTLPVEQSFAQWASSHGLSGANAAPGAVVANDGVSNALKYLIGVNPTASISTSDRNALPTVGTLTRNGIDYLTLTYRKSVVDGGITAMLQTSSDLKTWTTDDPPDYSNTIGSDPITHDPIVQVGAKLVGGKQFIRLELVIGGN